jgi:hypothetical protein
MCIAAGLVQGILFSNNDGERDVGTEATMYSSRHVEEKTPRKLWESKSIRKSEVAFSISYPRKSPRIWLT